MRSVLQQQTQRYKPQNAANCFYYYSKTVMIDLTYEWLHVLHISDTFMLK